MQLDRTLSHHSNLYNTIRPERSNPQAVIPAKFRDRNLTRQLPHTPAIQVVAGKDDIISELSIQRSHLALQNLEASRSRYDRAVLQALVAQLSQM